MPKKITQADDIGTLQDTDVFPVGRPGDNGAYKGSIAQVKSAVAPANKTTLEKITESTGMPKWDGGEWPTKNPLAVYESAVDLRGTAFQFDSNGVLYGATNSAVYKSTDMGWTWSAALKTFTPCWIARGMFIDSNDSVYVSFHGVETPVEEAGIWRSADGGTTWSRVLVLPQYCGIFAMAEFDNGVMVATAYTTTWGVGAGTTFAVLYRSADGGLTWTATYKDTNESLTEGQLYTTPVHNYYHLHDVKTDPYNPGTAYFTTDIRHDMASGRYGIYKTIDYGLTWTPIFPTTSPQLAGIYCGDGYRLFAADQHGMDFNIYKTTDDVTWTSKLSIKNAANPPTIHTFTLVSNPTTGHIFCFLANYLGVYVSIDDGETWEAIKLPSSPKLTGQGYVYCSNFYNNNVIAPFSLNNDPLATNYSYDLIWEPSTRMVDDGGRAKIISPANNATAAVDEGMFRLNDTDIGDVTTTRHGLVPKAPGDIDKFLRGDGTWAVASGGFGDMLVYDDTSAGNESLTLTNSGLANTRGYTIEQFSSNIGGATITAIKGRGTKSTPAAVQMDDYIYGFVGKAYDSSTTPALQIPAVLAARVAAAPTSGGVPACWDFETGTTATDRQARLRIWHDGLIEAIAGKGFFKGDGSRLYRKIITVSTNTYIDVDTPVVIASGTIDIYEPNNCSAGHVVEIRNIGSGVVTFNANWNGVRKVYGINSGSQLNTIAISAYHSAKFIYEGIAWYCVALSSIGGASQWVNETGGISYTDKVKIGASGAADNPLHVVSGVVAGGAARFERSDTLSSAPACMVVQHTTTAAPTIGLGTEIDFVLTDTAVTKQIIGGIKIARSTTTDVSCDFSIILPAAGVFGEKFRSKANGTIVLNTVNQVHNGSKALTDNASTNICEIALAAGDMVGGWIDAVIYITDGTDYQTHNCSVQFAAHNKAGTIATPLKVHYHSSGSGSGSTLMTAGTFSEVTAWTVTAGTGKITIAYQFDSSLTVTSAVMKYTLRLMDDAVITIL